MSLQKSKKSKIYYKVKLYFFTLHAVHHKILINLTRLNILLVSRILRKSTKFGKIGRFIFVPPIKAIII